MPSIKVIIDGKKYLLQKQQTLLEFAIANDIDIPHLCYDSRLTPSGKCRLCLVTVKEQNGLVPACTLALQNNMNIETKTQPIIKARKEILKLLLNNNQCSDCKSCNKNGICELQRYADQYEIFANLTSPYVNTTKEQKRQNANSIKNYSAENKAIAFDADKCIGCGRCVKICNEVQMDNALLFNGRGDNTRVSTIFDIPLNESSCSLCGQCISTCPTAALSGRQIGQEPDQNLKSVTTVCPYCGVGCQIELKVNPCANTLARVSGKKDCEISNGNLCIKGRFGMDFISSEKRLTTPLIKHNNRFEETTWENALTLITEKFNKIKKTYGANSLAGLSSAKCTNEDNYIFQKFFRAVIGTNNIDHCARLCHASTIAGLSKAFGSGAMTNSINELKKAACIFVIGSNTTETHPVIALTIKKAVVKNGAKLIVADPREIDLTRFAKLHLAQQPGTDVALINTMIHIIIKEKLHDQKFIDSRTENFSALLPVIEKFTPQKGSAITKIPEKNLIKAARMYAKAKTASIVYSMGITQHTTGTDNVLNLANLAMMTGNVGKIASGVNPLRGQNNVQGACDVGALPDVYPGYQSVKDKNIQQKFETHWNTSLSDAKGLTTIEIIESLLNKKIRGLYIMGENPALSNPNLNRTLKALAQTDFLVVQDIFFTETAKFADVVLPSTCFAEKEGTFTNTERRIQRVRKALNPPGLARNDWEIIRELSNRMGYTMHYENEAAIMEEIAALTPIYGGISFPRIDKTGLQWPCPNKNHSGTTYLHKDKFTKGKGVFHAVDFKNPDELPDERYPFILSTGRQLNQFHTGTMSRKSLAINQISAKGYVEINPIDAQNLNIKNGELVEIKTPRGKITTTARISKTVQPKLLFIPFHFLESPVNILTNDKLDPIAKIPEFKVCAAAVKHAAYK